MLYILLILLSILGWASFLYVRYKMYAYDGKLVVTNTDEGGKLFSLELDTDPYEIEEKSHIVLKVSIFTDFE